MRERKPVEGVIFDLGRVLLNYDTARTSQALEAHSALSKESIHTTIFAGELLHTARIPYENGMMTCEEFYDSVRGPLGLQGLSFDAFCRCWPDIIGPADGIDVVLGRLRTGLHRGILSNIDRLNWGVAQHLPLLEQHFSRAHCTLSYEERQRKPSPDIYRTAVKRLGLTPSVVLYIDDRIENVEAALHIGFSAEQYDCSMQPVSRLESILERHGALH